MFLFLKKLPTQSLFHFFDFFTLQLFVFYFSTSTFCAPTILDNSCNKLSVGLTRYSVSMRRRLPPDSTSKHTGVAPGFDCKSDRTASTISAVGFPCSLIFNVSLFFSTFSSPPFPPSPPCPLTTSGYAIHCSFFSISRI